MSFTMSSSPLLRHTTLSISLLMLASLTGCQTAPNQNAPAKPPIQSTTITTPTRSAQPVHSNQNSNQNNQSITNTQTIGTNDSDSQQQRKIPSEPRPKRNDPSNNATIANNRTDTQTNGDINQHEDNLSNHNDADNSPINDANIDNIDTDSPTENDNTQSSNQIDDTDSLILIPPIEPPSRHALLERARQNSQSQNKTTNHNDGDNLPAFRRLMQAGINQLANHQLTDAQTSFTRAQRLAPKSSAVYFYLAQVALKKNQPRKAEAMARRGLVVSQDINRRHALWQLILQAGQQQNNLRVIEEANKALKQLTM